MWCKTPMIISYSHQVNQTVHYTDLHRAKQECKANQKESKGLIITNF